MTDVGGGNGGARLVLCEASVGETTNESRDNSGGAHELPPERGRSETERDCGTSTYYGTYCDLRRAENESAY